MADNHTNDNNPNNSNNNKKDAKKDKKDKKKPTFGPENWSHPVKEGILTKRGQVVKNWKHRFFRLQGSNLIYFEDIRSKKPKGVIPLTGATINVMLQRSGDHQHCFEIVSPKRTFLISAPSDSDAEAWATALKKAAAAPASSTSLEKKPREASDPDLKDVEIIGSKTVQSNLSSDPKVSAVGEFARTRQIDDYSAASTSAVSLSERRGSSGGSSISTMSSTSGVTSTITSSSTNVSANGTPSPNRSRSGGLIRPGTARKPPTPVSFALEGESPPQSTTSTTSTPVVHLTPSPQPSTTSTVSNSSVILETGTGSSRNSLAPSSHATKKKSGLLSRRNLAVALLVLMLAMFVYLDWFGRLRSKAKVSET